MPLINSLNQESTRDISSDKCATRKDYLSFEVSLTFSSFDIFIYCAAFSSVVWSSAHDAFYCVVAGARSIGCLVGFDGFNNGFAEFRK
jgi:hypothetical protein